MSQPITFTPIRPGPSGSQRSGSTSGFTNLAADLDANFATFRNWAAQVEPHMTLATYPTANWFSSAIGWAATADTKAWKFGRIVVATIVAAYTGSIVSTAGDVNPDRHLATITAVELRPPTPVILTAPGYTGVYVSASLQVNVDGTIVVTGLSAAITATNPGFCITAAWSTAP